MHIPIKFLHLQDTKSFLFKSTSTMAVCGLILCPMAKADNQLIGRAVLPARTFSQGPTSGTLLGDAPINHINVPFLGKQPIQGFSGSIRNPDGTFWMMPDNGYGSIENSSDFNLRVYLVRPDFKTENGGSGRPQVIRHIELRDPNHQVPFSIVNEFSRERVLTGADFDIESIQAAPDGTFWIGDEFGPLLLRINDEGIVLEAPIPLPDYERGGELRSAQNPFNEEASMIRILNAIRARGDSFGATKSPVCSPDFALIDDGDAATGVDSRLNPPPGSGLAPASSDIVNIASLHSAGYAIVPYTVDDPAMMRKLIAAGIDGLISDRSDLLYAAVKEVRPDFLTPNGLIDPTKFDAQGHRGSRNLRPESTLPAFEAGLDNLINTLETDCGLTKDHVLILSHDPFINSQKISRVDGEPIEGQPLIKDFTAEELQSTYRVDKLFRGPTQQNDPKLSPVSVAFFNGDTSQIYVMPRLQQLFDFVRLYEKYYRNGPGKNQPDAEKRWKNAAQVRFNLETKTNPRKDKDPLGRVWAERTFGPELFAEKLAGAITANGLTERAFVQSFDFRELLFVQQHFPKIQIVCLIGDAPEFADQSIAGSDDGDNLQPEPGETTSPWLGGLFWPYRQTKLNHPFRVQTSGGLEGMALTPNKQRLLPMLEKPLIDGAAGTDLIFEFDLTTKQFTGNQWFYRLEPNGVSVGDFQMVDDVTGATLERDNSQGDLNGFKAVETFTLGVPKTYVTKTGSVNLMALNDPLGLSLFGSQPGDIGIGPNYAFPYVTIENLVIFDPATIAVINDNNFPFSVGRHLGTGLPDDNEFILIHLDHPLNTADASSQ
jgi:glycerophosphoryl diester phosphodiesterase